MSIKNIICPNCQKENSIKTSKGKMLVCTNCGSMIDTVSGDLIKARNQKTFKTLCYLQLENNGTLDGKELELLGYIKLMGRDSEDTWYWEEWFAVSGDKYFWVHYDQDTDKYTLFEQTKVTKPINPKGLRKWQTIEINDGEKFRINEVEQGVVQEVAGVLPWRVEPGYKMNYADGVGNGLSYSIEWSDKEIEVYKGKEFTREHVLKALNEKALPVLAEERRKKKQAQRIQSIITLIIIIIVCCVCSAMMFVDSTSPTGPVFFTGGGGSGGGK